MNDASPSIQQPQYSLPVGTAILLTRPQEDNERLAQLLTEKHIPTFSFPLLHIKFSPPPRDFIQKLDAAQALVFTSANGLRAFAMAFSESLTNAPLHKTSYINKPIFCVGEATGREAKEIGFTNVIIAGGDVDHLATLICKTTKPEYGPLLHIAASHLAGDLQAYLSQENFKLERIILYKTEKTDFLSNDLQDKIKQQHIYAVTFYSPRTAKSFAELIEKAKLTQELRHIHALCLSKNVALQIKAFKWASIHVAHEPTQSALLKELEAIMPENTLLTDYSTEEIISAFGGIRPMATKINVAVSTVQGWKNRNHIPESHLKEIMEAVEKFNIVFSKSEVNPSASASSAQASPIDETPNSNDTSDDKKEKSSMNETVTEKSKPSQQENKKMPEDISKPPQDKTATNATRKSVSAFSIASISLLTIALITQPFWAPKIEEKLTPVIEKFAPNLALQSTNDQMLLIEALQIELNKTKQETSALKQQIAELDNRALSSEDIKSQVTAQITKGLTQTSAAYQATATQISQLQTDIARLQQEFSSYGNATSLQTNADGAVDLTPILQNLSKLEGKIQTLNKDQLRLQSQMTTNLQQYQAELEHISQKQLEQIQTATPASSSTLPNLASLIANLQTLFSIDNLIDRVNQGTLTAELVTQLNKSFKNTPDLPQNIQDIFERLTLLAQSNIPTIYDLQQEFEQIARRPEHYKANATFGNWLETTLNNLKNIIAIRRVDAPESLPPISAAEQAIKHGNLPLAIQHLTPLKTERDDINSWLLKAVKYQNAQKYLSQLQDFNRTNIITYMEKTVHLPSNIAAEAE